MSNSMDHLSATDKDIYDILMSGKQRVTESVLHELSRDRGIFYSSKDTRDELIENISTLIHDYHDIQGIINKRDQGRRGEKTTSVVLKAELSIDEIKAAVCEYEKESGPTEKVLHHKTGEHGLIVNLEYDEFNHSRTRLLQRQHHDAKIEFSVKDGQTIIRMPATEKSKIVAGIITDKIEKSRKETLVQEKIELTCLTTPQAKSAFFTSLISQMSGYKLIDVTNLRVSSHKDKDNSDNELDIEESNLENQEASNKMYAAVHSMALSGQNLVQSEEYQQLIKKGFFIASITWRAQIVGLPYDIVQFDAGFENKQKGTGFKYGVHGSFKFNNGVHRKTLSGISDLDKVKLFSLIEYTAKAVLVGLVEKEKSDSQDDAGGDHE